MKKFDWIDAATGLAAIAIFVFLIFIPPIIGVANDGDFHRILGGFSLSGGDVNDEFKFIDGQLEFGPSHYLKGTFDSSEHWLAFLAITLDSIVHPGTSWFDIRAIGFIHGALYLCAIFLALPLLRDWSAVARAAGGGVILLVFCDVLYVSQMNSFYQDTAALIFLVLSAVMMARVLKFGRRRDATGMVVALLLFACSKTQHALLLAPILVLLVVQANAFLPGFSRFARVSSIVLLAAVSFYTFRAVSPWYYKGVPLFSEIFYKVLPRATNPSEELRMLGLDESYAKYIGMHAYSSGSPANDETFEAEFLKKTSHQRLVLFFLRKPGRCLTLIIRGLAEVGAQRPYLGNYERGTGVKEWSMSPAFSMWSTLKAKLFEHRGGLYLTYIGLLCLGLLRVLWKRGSRASIGAGIALLMMMLMALAIGILGDGTDTLRHAVLFTALNDLVLVSMVLVFVSNRTEHQEQARAEE